MKEVSAVRIRFFSSLVTVVVFIAAAPCAASWDQWVWHLGASTATSSQSAHVGVAPEAADGYDALDRYLSIGPHACVGIFHIDGQSAGLAPPAFTGKICVPRLLRLWERRRPGSCIRG